MSVKLGTRTVDARYTASARLCLAQAKQSKIQFAGLFNPTHEAFSSDKNSVKWKIFSPAGVVSLIALLRCYDINVTFWQVGWSKNLARNFRAFVRKHVCTQQIVRKGGWYVTVSWPVAVINEPFSSFAATGWPFANRLPLNLEKYEGIICESSPTSVMNVQKRNSQTRKCFMTE